MCELPQAETDVAQDGKSICRERCHCCNISKVVDVGPGYGSGWQWWKGCAGSHLIWPECFRAIANWLKALITFDGNSMVLCAVLHSMSGFLCRPGESQAFCQNLWSMGCSYRRLWESMHFMAYYGIYGSARFYGPNTSGIPIFKCTLNFILNMLTILKVLMLFKCEPIF